MSEGLVRRLSPELTGKQRRKLRGLAHALKPVVRVGQNSNEEARWENLIGNVESALLAHELIKVKLVPTSDDDFAGVAEKICTATGAQLAQKIGRILVFYRPHPEEPTIVL